MEMCATCGEFGKDLGWEWCFSLVLELLCLWWILFPNNGDNFRFKHFALPSSSCIPMDELGAGLIPCWFWAEQILNLSPNRWDYSRKSSQRLRDYQPEPRAWILLVLVPNVTIFCGICADFSLFFPKSSRILQRDKWREEDNQE